MVSTVRKGAVRLESVTQRQDTSKAAMVKGRGPIRS